MKDTSFYDKESSSYSAKRYPINSTYYGHYFFKKRRDILETQLLQIKKEKTVTEILEIGCGDGVITESIAKVFPDAEIIAIDIAEGMIENAKKRSIPNTSFFVRGSEPQRNYSLIIELGVLNLVELEQEINYVNFHLKENSIFVVSVAHKDSALNFFRPFASTFQHLQSLKYYDSFFRNKFSMIQSVSYGLFIPLIWHWTQAARYIQPLVEWLVPLSLDFLFHETIFILKKK